MQNTGLIEKIQKLPPETIVEVEHFVDSLTEQKKRERYEALLAFAREFGGTELDLDKKLEAAGIEHLLETTK